MNESNKITESKLPPIEKIAEAYSVIADDRIKRIDDNTYIVTSSNGERQYKVTIKGNRYRSDDNATKFQRYAGYPILATLMLNGSITFPTNLTSVMKGINWNAINKKYKRNYAAALNAALTDKGLSATEIDEVKAAINNSYEQFVQSDIVV